MQYGSCFGAMKSNVRNASLPLHLFHTHSSPSSFCQVRPAKLPNLDRVGHVFSWNYPDSWEKPCTYFSLQFQVKAVRRGETCNSDKHILVMDTYMIYNVLSVT